MKKILITNASTGLGITLANLLLNNPDNYIYAYDYKLSKNTPSLFTLLKNEHYNFSEIDLTKDIECDCDEIYHLSPCINKEKYLSDKFGYIIKELDILKNILNYCSIKGSKLLFTNYFNDYSNQNTEYFPYFDAVKMMHSLIKEFSLKEKVNYKIANISYYYGVNTIPSKDNFIGDFIFKSFNNETIEIYVNEYVFLTNVKDIALALKIIMENYSELDIYDVTNLPAVLKSDVLKLIMNFTKSNSKAIINQENPVSPVYNPDISLLNNSLNFKCTKQILEGISETIDFYKLMYFS